MTTSYQDFIIIFSFLVRSHLDKEYIQTIDKKLKNNDASSQVKQMVQKVRDFHNMRSNLIQTVYKHLGPGAFITQFSRCTGIEQYNTVPTSSSCALTNEEIQPKQGILIILHHVNGEYIPFTIHKRFKRLLYSVWFLVHTPKEIMLPINKWLKTQTWWINKNINNYEEVVARIVKYNEEIFIKKSYIKLKDIGTHIQSDIVLAAKPINSSSR